MNWINSYRYLLKSGGGEYFEFLLAVRIYVRRSVLSNCFTYKFSTSVGGAGRSIRSLGSWASKPKRINSKFNYILNPFAYGLAGGFLLLKHGRSSLEHVSESTPFFQDWNEFKILEMHSGYSGRSRPPIPNQGSGGRRLTKKSLPRMWMSKRSRLCEFRFFTTILERP
jgi:hypothetical protein